MRAALLTLLAEGPSNGYRLMQTIAERTDDLWRPSPGSVYPALAQLTDEGLVEPTEVDGRPGVTLTDEGRRWVEEHKDDPAPWDTVPRPHSAHGTLRESAMTLMAALHTVAEAGTPAQVESARTVLDDARRALYRLLAEDTATPAPSGSASDDQAAQSAEEAPGRASDA